jgi:hypothetical protein
MGVQLERTNSMMTKLILGSHGVEIDSGIIASEISLLFALEEGTEFE